VAAFLVAFPLRQGRLSLAKIFKQVSACFFLALIGHKGAVLDGIS
jgi:hypothetical protein